MLRAGLFNDERFKDENLADFLLGIHSESKNGFGLDLVGYKERFRRAVRPRYLSTNYRSSKRTVQFVNGYATLDQSDGKKPA
jgi:hypothetical protein